MFALASRVPELRHSGGSIGQQKSLELRIDPSARHHACAVPRSNFMLEVIYQRIEGSGIDQTFFNQKRFEGFDA